MRLPDRIEHEIRAIELSIERDAKQFTGQCRLRGLRAAIEEYMKTRDHIQNYVVNQYKPGFGDE